MAVGQTIYKSLSIILKSITFFPTHFKEEDSSSKKDSGFSKTVHVNH